MNSQEFLTVSEVNNYIRDVISSGFPQAIWVCGEVQELRDKKHLYFTLSEKDPDSNTVTARIGATIWANVRPRIDAVLQKAENAFVLKDDIEVKLLCKVDFYPPFGQLRLIVEGIDPTYTLGKIAQDRQRLITLLKQKGILDKNKQLAMPHLPLNIGLITSYNSAAYHDFVDELKKSGYAFNVWLMDSLMQGKSAEQSVARSIHRLNQIKDIDLIVITRGGGSITELSCFDSQIIAESISSSRFPVLSGIGHEINTTVTDLASHTFAKTPTAAAHLIIGRIEEFIKRLDERHKYLFELLDRTLTDHKEHVKGQALLLQQSTLGWIQNQKDVLVCMKESLKRLPISTIKASRSRVLNRLDDISQVVYYQIDRSKSKLKSSQKLVMAFDPLNTLKRGFSITRDHKGKLIKTIKDLKSVKTVKTQLIDGILTSEVTLFTKG